jgi:hypothetical protein
MFRDCGYALLSVYEIILNSILFLITYDHRKLKTGIPVRSSLLKQLTGGLVVRWVTTSESPLSYVFTVFLLYLEPVTWLVLGTQVS